MFDENFSFDTPRSPSLDSSTTTTTRDSSRAVSPCSTAGPYPPPRYSVTDLAAQFADQRIQKGSQICYDSCDTYANNDNDADWSIPSIEDTDLAPLSHARTFPQRAHSPSRRAQRQLNTRLLCTASHQRDISSLVANMVDSHDQCLVASPDSFTSTTVDDDEGYNSGNEVTMTTSRRSSVATIRSRHDYRRSSDLKANAACVSKSIRFRKDRHHRRVRSSEHSS